MTMKTFLTINLAWIGILQHMKSNISILNTGLDAGFEVFHMDTKSRVEIHAAIPELIIRPCTGLIEAGVSSHVTRTYTGPEQMP